MVKKTEFYYGKIPLRVPCKPRFTELLEASDIKLKVKVKTNIYKYIKTKSIWI